MKLFILVILCSGPLLSFGQPGNPVRLRTTGTFSIVNKGLSMNMNGIGGGLDASFFAKHRLQLLVESGVDHFFGSKLFIEEDKGRQNKNPLLFSLQAGPQWFFTKSIAVSATYGPTWHAIHTVGFSTDPGFKFGITGVFGTKKRFVTKLFFVHIPMEYTPIQYFGTGIGFRII